MTDIMTLASPPNWQLYRLGQLFRERKEKGSDKDFPPLSVTMRGIVPQLETAAKTDDGDNRKVVRVGDYVINSRSDRKGSGGISDYEGSVSLISIVLEPRDDIEPRYAHHLMRSPAFQEEFYRWGHGIVADLWTTRFGDMKNIRLRVPDLTTQRQIADFLDRETARIDLLIEKKQRLVALLGEREENYIKGVLSGENIACLDKKTTEAPWLKSVPSRWDVVPLRHLVKIQTGNRDTKDREDDGEYPFFVRSMTVERINSYSFDEEAVLTSGDGAGVGIVFHHINCKFDLHQRMYAFTDFNRVSGRYFYFFLRTFFKLQMTQWSAKSTVDSVRMPFLKTLLVTVPPKEEQQRLVEDIENRAERDALVKERTIVSIARLKEYRSALITAAVKGQIDVSTYAKSGTPDRRLDAIQKEMGA